ncbi:hypothetical protein Ciccas_009753 [Cichlidogyrus casuarinus]|uniref:Uncharacterized protein n=1 Tax=Cichlidogyrus casuarinus TaxID=1844966 RepID=A0ABD2PYX2_9PLAT
MTKRKSDTALMEDLLKNLEENVPEKTLTKFATKYFHIFSRFNPRKEKVSNSMVICWLKILGNLLDDLPLKNDEDNLLMLPAFMNFVCKLNLKIFQESSEKEELIEKVNGILHQLICWGEEKVFDVLAKSESLIFWHKIIDCIAWFHRGSMDVETTMPELVNNLTFLINQGGHAVPRVIGPKKMLNFSMRSPQLQDPDDFNFFDSLDNYAPMEILVFLLGRDADDVAALYDIFSEFDPDFATGKYGILLKTPLRYVWDQANHQFCNNPENRAEDVALLMVTGMRVFGYPQIDDYVFTALNGPTPSHLDGIPSEILSEFSCEYFALPD